MMMMEDHKMRAPGKFRFSQNRINGGFKHQDSELGDNPEKKIIKSPMKLKKIPVRSSSMDSCCTETSNSDSDCNTFTFDSHWNTSANAISDSDKFHLLQWAKTARRGRKSLSTSTSTSYSSSEKQIVPFSGENKAQSSLSDHDSEASKNFSEPSDEKEVEPLSGDEKEAVNTPLPLSVRYPGDFRVSGVNFQIAEKNRVAEIPDLKRKREIEDTNIIDFTNFTKDIARTETKDCRDEIIFDILKETNSKATHKQVPSGKTFSCGTCGRTFNCHQALGGHKSSCKSNFPPKGQVGESSLQGGSMRNASSGPHQCKLCGMCFATGQALGGHQGIHRTGQVKPRIPGSWLSLSPATNEMMRKEAVSRNNYLAPSVQQAQTNKKRKVMLFGCNLAEHLPQRMIELF